MHRIAQLCGALLLGHVIFAGDLTSRCEYACLKPERNWSCGPCTTGCHGRMCDQRCQRCNVDGCEKNSGRCHRCQPGYYGDECDIKCPPGCLEGEEGVTECDRTTGVCMSKCRKGFFDERCDEKCPQNCKHSSCNRYNGVCIHGCQKGWSGFFCNTTCGNCFHRTCGLYGHCKHGCKDGYHGNKCTKPCINCDGRCDGNTGKCFQCAPGFYGFRCNYECSKTCGHLQDGSQPCDRSSGRCTNDCVPGHFGYHCSHKCNKNCKFSTCSVHDGFCNQGCREGWTGFQCETPRNCLRDRYDGTACTFGCIIGMTGKSCDVVCPLNCKSCDHDTGRCTSCHEGYYGNACVQDCSFWCKNRTCNMDGSCTAGCHDGFHGDQCNKMCEFFCLSCHRHNGKCTTDLLQKEPESSISASTQKQGAFLEVIGAVLIWPTILKQL